MNQEKFTAYLKKRRKPDSTIKQYSGHITAFGEYLSSHTNVKSVDEAVPDDLREFAKWAAGEGINVYRYMWGIRNYYDCTEYKPMSHTAYEVMALSKLDERKLREFLNVDKDSVKKLSAMGISTPKKLLDKCQAKEDRAELAKSAEVPEGQVLELVKLSDLSRLPGLKKVRGRLFFEGGLDTLDKIAALEPEEVIATLQEYIDRSGFKGIPPTLSEAASAVSMARFLPRVVEY